jgi:hypothetical protein
MQHLAPPQYSPDGQWWWNGQSWVRVTWAVQGRGGLDGRTYDERVFDEEPRRRTPGVLWVGLIALLLLLLLAFGASFVNWTSLQGLGLGLGGQATPAPTAPAAPATPAPTATPQSGTAGSGAYQQVVSADIARFQAAGQTVENRCTLAAVVRDSSGCRAALQAMDDSVQGFQNDLSGVTAPACLQPADSQLRTALSEYHQGIQQELNGIDNQDLGAVAQGAGTLNDATGHARSAASLLQGSSC